MKILGLSAAMALSLMCVTTAEATPVATVTYTGTVSSVSNISAGYFPNAAVGDSWTATYIFDLGTGNLQTSATLQRLSGGINNGAPTPLLGASLIIGSTSLSLIGGFDDAVTVSDNGGTQSLLNAKMRDTVTGGPGTDYLLNNNFTATDSAWPALIQPLAFTMDGGDTGNGFLFFVSNDVNWNILADLRTVNVTVADATAVPEPLTASLFGAGLIGAVAMRRRNSRAKVAT